MEALREIVMFEKGSHINYEEIPPEEMMEWPQQAFIGGFASTQCETGIGY